MAADAAKISAILTAAAALTEAEVLAGLPPDVVERLKTEKATPLVAALGLSDALWVDNPHKGQKGASRATRTAERDTALARALAFYRLKGGKELEKTAAFFEETFAAPNLHDGQISHPGA